MLTAGAVQASASLSNVQPAHVEIDAAPVAVVNRAITNVLQCPFYLLIADDVTRRAGDE